MTNNRVGTTFLSHEETIYLPAIDPNRINSDHLLHFTRSKGSAFQTYYDVYQRRWYQINFVPERDKYPHNVEETLLHHILSHDQPFNTVNIDQHGNTTFQLTNIGEGIRGLPIISKTTFPIINYYEITQKRYFNSSVDTCMWNGMNCYFKPIEGEYDIHRIEREIFL